MYDDLVDVGVVVLWCEAAIECEYVFLHFQSHAVPYIFSVWIVLDERDELFLPFVYFGTSIDAVEHVGDR